jgi:hypothetical protein
MATIGGSTLAHTAPSLNDPSVSRCHYRLRPELNVVGTDGQRRASIELTRQKEVEKRAQFFALCGSTQELTELKLGHQELFVEGARDSIRSHPPHSSLQGSSGRKLFLMDGFLLFHRKSQPPSIPTSHRASMRGDAHCHKGAVPYIPPTVYPGLATRLPIFHDTGTVHTSLTGTELTLRSFPLLLIKFAFFFSPTVRSIGS